MLPVGGVARGGRPRTRHHARPGVSCFADYDVAGARILVVDAGPVRRRLRRSDLTASLTRPEIAAALDGQRATGSRRSRRSTPTSCTSPSRWRPDGSVHGAVRITLPPRRSTSVRAPGSAWPRCRASSWSRWPAWAWSWRAASPGRSARSKKRPSAWPRAISKLGRATSTDRPESTLARQFDTTAERLAQLVEVQRRFVSDASHQLRTPLTALRLRLETMQPTADDRPRVDAALAETDRLSRLVQSLLVIARSEAAEPELADVDLAAIARDRRDAWSEFADRSAVDLVIEGPESLVVRAVDGGVEQILDNLLSNALDISPEHTTITIGLTSNDDGGGQLTVTDQGPGMTDDQRRQATARFWRPPGSTSSGSGRACDRGPPAPAGRAGCSNQARRAGCAHGSRSHLPGALNERLPERGRPLIRRS